MIEVSICFFAKSKADFTRVDHKTVKISFSDASIIVNQCHKLKFYYFNELEYFDHGWSLV